MRLREQGLLRTHSSISIQRTCLRRPNRGLFKRKHGFHVFHSWPWQSWAPLVLDICGLLSSLWSRPFFAQCLPQESWDQPCAQRTSKMCFGLHSFTVKSTQVIFMLFIKNNFYFTCSGEGNNKRSQQVLVVVYNTVLA